MNNLYNETDINNIIHRIEQLTPSSQRQWGKMNIGQMLAHVNISLETAMGLNFPKRIFIGRIIGSFVKNKFLNDKPMSKNAPTDNNYIITKEMNFEQEQKKAIRLIREFYQNGPENCTTHPHPFFGRLTSQERAILQWKHFDHHLRQFNA